MELTTEQIEQAKKVIAEEQAKRIPHLPWRLW